jgi:hypothetical protein
MEFKCNIFSRGVASGKIKNPSVMPLAKQWDSFVARAASRIYDALIRYLGPFSSEYPINPTIKLLPDALRKQGVNALFDKDKDGTVYLNLEMMPIEEEEIEYKLPYCIGNLLHEFMHANLADFIYQPPEGVSPEEWGGDPFYDEGYLDFMGEIIASDSSIWVDPEMGEFGDLMFAGYVASNNRRLLNALGLSPGQNWSVPDFHIKRWAGQEYARKIGGSLFERFIEFKEQEFFFYPVGCGPERNYDVKTY